MCTYVNFNNIKFSHTVPVQVINLTRQTDGPLTPSHLLSGSNVILTCELSGFPQPNVTFVRIMDTIVPGVSGFERLTFLNFDQVCCKELVTQ